MMFRPDRLLIPFLILTTALAPHLRAAEAPVPQDVQDALKSLNTADDAARQTAYQLFADKGDARLIPVLKAYRDGLLFLRGDRLVIFGERVDVPGKGRMLPLLDALTAAPVTGSDGKPIYSSTLTLPDAKKLPQPPRGERPRLSDMVSSLQLLDPDPDTRKRSIRDIGERAGRAFVDPQDQAKCVDALKRCEATLKPMADAKAADAVTAIDAALAFTPASTLSPAPAGPTLSKVTASLKSLDAATLAREEVKDAILKSQNLQDRIDARAKVLDELAKYEPLIRKQLDKDPNGPFKTTLLETLAEIAAVRGDRAAQLAAVPTLGQIGTNRAQTVLDRLLKAANYRQDTELQSAVAPAARKAARYQTEIAAVQNTFAGISLGSILVLLALGLSIIFGLMGVINMAHGEFMMVGAFTTYVVSEFFKHHFPGAYDYYPIAAIPAAFLAAGAAGLLAEWLVIRHLYGRPLETLLATWGVGLVLIWAVRWKFGDTLSVTPPRWMEGGVEVSPDLTLPLNRIYIIFFCAICIFIVYFIVNRTKMGLLLRATTQNREMAAALGVPTRRVDALTFAFGTGLAGLAGVIVPLYNKINPEMGREYIVDSFMVVVVGGVGKLAGAIVSGIGLGFITKYLEALFQHIALLASGASVVGKVVVLMLIVAFLQWRPAGLFPPKGRNADA